MFRKIFKKDNKKEIGNKNILIASLLIHAAKIDDNYTNIEKEIIKKALINLNLATSNEVEKLLIEAEKKEMESNQLIEFTGEIKKNSIEFRLKIVEILWKIVYSDAVSDNFESNLIRRVCGLLYVADRDSGLIKRKVKNSME